MHDRQPTPGQEGRVKITRENGESFFARIEMADTPLHEGTPLTKQTLLQDATAAMFGMDKNAVPNDVFAFLSKYNQHWWARTGAGETVYLHSPIRNAYPDGDTVDGFAYRYLGVPFDNAVKRTGFERIAVVDYTEDTYSYYIELPMALSNYSFLMYNAYNIKSKNNQSIPGCSVYPVQSLESTETDGILFGYSSTGLSKAIGRQTNGLISLAHYPVDGVLSAQDTSMSATVATNAREVIDTKYLYAFVSDTIPHVAGGHLEIWGLAR